MKARHGKRTTARRLFPTFVLLLALAVWTSSTLADEQAEPAQKSGEQTAVQPSQSPGSPGEAQQAKAAQEPVAPQLPDAAAPQPEAAGTSYPPEYVPLIQKTTAALMSASFTFYPIKAIDPFVPFIEPETNSPLRLPEEEDDSRAGSDRPPLTPLQKMTLSEIERGLKAISWGELGKRAVIEDSTGRGYIVTVGTPAGERSGVITQIFNDHLVIHQEIWDRKAKKRVPQDFTIKLSKKTDNQ
jgi:type IV pilus assembly protein PilP